MRTVALLAIIACGHSQPAPPKPAPKVAAEQVLTAVIDDWSSTKATLTLWAHDDEHGWRSSEPWPAVIGHTGAAWGTGLHGTGAPAGRTGPVKHEGDGASPAGIFAITSAFGTGEYATTTQLPYTLLSDSTECVDDPQSTAYNTITERTPAADWTSSEHMQRVAGYEIGAFIAHNPARTPGGGSCIFLHVWSGPDSNTVGCTAMAKRDLGQLLLQLSPGAVFVLLPRAEYRVLQDPWGLPPQ